MNYVCALLVCSLSIGCLGCSGRVATYPASGTVRFDDGEPVRIGVIEFRCEENGLSARAKLDDTGSFSLGTFADADGAPAGTYKVIVAQYFNVPPHKHAHEEHDARHDHEPDARVAPKFSDYSTSPLRATISADAENKFHLQVSHPR